MGKTDVFLKEYDGRSIQDDGAYNSEEMRSFARKFRNYLKRNLPGWAVTKYHCGHYFVSGFLVKSGRYVYFSYNVPRGGMSMNLYSGAWQDGVLIRTALDDMDYSGRGGWNHYTSIASIATDVENLVKEQPSARKERAFL